MKARVFEQGNGFPSVGDYCVGAGHLYLVKAIDSRIQTDSGNYVFADVSSADWSDCAEGDEHTARVQLEDRW